MKIPIIGVNYIIYVGLTTLFTLLRLKKWTPYSKTQDYVFPNFSFFIHIDRIRNFSIQSSELVNSDNNTHATSLSNDSNYLVISFGKTSKCQVLYNIVKLPQDMS